MIRPIQIVVQNGQPKNGRVDQLRNNYEAIRRIRKLDPMFDEDRLSQVKLVYLQLQSAWTEKD